MDKQKHKSVLSATAAAKPLFSRPIRKKQMRRTLWDYN